MGLNFGEDLAYWYLRLNGFFTINNFVLHKSSDELEYTADSDILAVRPAGVSESIEGIDLPIDSKLTESWKMSPQQNLCALIVEVKTGAKFDASKSFSTERLKYAIQRLGDPIARELKEPSQFNSFLADRMLSGKGFDIAKLLIYDDQRYSKDLSDNAFYTLTLKDVGAFLRFRLCGVSKEISVRKDKDRLFFPDPLLQYLIWTESDQ